MEPLSDRTNGSTGGYRRNTYRPSQAYNGDRISPFSDIARPVAAQLVPSSEEEDKDRYDAALGSAQAVGLPINTESDDDDASETETCHCKQYRLRIMLMWVAIAFLIILSLGISGLFLYVYVQYKVKF